MNNNKRLRGLVLAAAFTSSLAFAQAGNSGFPLQPLADKPGRLSVKGVGKVFYVPSTLDTIQWGYLPNANSTPVLNVPSGATVVFDTVSHEGILEDQGRDPVKYFGKHGVPARLVLKAQRRVMC